jgi:sugar lactone lactonase YvrE
MDVALEAGAALGEGPRWDARIERLLWVDINGKALHRFDPATGEDEVWPMPAKVGSAAPMQDTERVLVALADRLAVVDTVSGGVEDLVALPHAYPGLRSNDGSVDPEGRFWVGTMNDDEHTPDQGALYRYDGGELTTVLAPISLSNGLDWIGDRMYYVDTPTKRIDVMDYDGDVSNRRPFAHIEEGVGVPDGLVLDDEGGIWLALYGGAEVRRYSPEGELTERLAVPADNVTAAWFAGTRLFITTARSPQPLGGSLFVAEPGVSGPSARPFAG